ncbi:hypothetical protein Mapa_002789 [Marchantia paleacea]|nr:hypothetical protein Mapa_002789 [Marchantia paleacea]
MNLGLLPDVIDSARTTRKVHNLRATTVVLPSSFEMRESSSGYFSYEQICSTVCLSENAAEKQEAEAPVELDLTAALTYCSQRYLQTIPGRTDPRKTHRHAGSNSGAPSTSSIAVQPQHTAQY